MKNEKMPKVLVVDDDPNVRRSLNRNLRRIGYKVVCAKDGREALKLLEFDLPDIILTDIFMPDMDGLELTIKIRKHAPELPMIAMSGGVFTRNKKICMLSAANIFGADFIINKPFSTKQIDAVISNLLI